MYDAKPAACLQVGAGAAFTLSGTGVFAYTWNFIEPATVKTLALKITTTISSSAGAVVTFYLRPTYGSATGQTVIGTITTGLTSASNTLFVNNITPVQIPAGSQVVANCTTAATSSGAGIAYIVADYSAEVSKNETAVTVVTA
jgi:hypothetical protein